MRVLLVMKFTLEKVSNEKFRIAQRELGISLRDRGRNEWIRHKTGISNIIGNGNGRAMQLEWKMNARQSVCYIETHLMINDQ